MAKYTVADAASILRVSPDTVRRWVDSGRLGGKQAIGGGRAPVHGEALARFSQSLGSSPTVATGASASARNRFTGIVTKVIPDKCMAPVEVQARFPPTP